MNPTTSWPYRIWLLTKSLVLILVLIYVYSQLRSTAQLTAERNNTLDQIQTARKSRVIAMIHREETVSLFGVPVSHSISIEDSEAILRAIRTTPPNQPIDIVLHTPGGLLLAAEQIAKALQAHKGKVTVFVPHYAMSGGTLLALAADQIVMDPNAVLGPVDPQIGDMPAASIVTMVELKGPKLVGDEMLVLADVAQKARLQTLAFVAQLLTKHFPKEKALQIATVLTEGRFTHDFPIMVEQAKELGLPVSDQMPQQIYHLMDLYPQGGGSRPSVMYIPLHRDAPSGVHKDTAKQAPSAPASK